MTGAWKRLGAWVSVLGFLAAVGTRSAGGQTTGRRPVLGPNAEVYRAPGSCDPDPENGTLAPPYQLWQRVDNLDIEPENRDIPRHVIWRSVQNQGFSGRDEIFGLYFFETREVLLTPSTQVRSDRQEEEPEGVPCRYLVTGGDTYHSRGIFRKVEQTGRITAVKIGSILNVAVIERPALSPELRQRYVAVDIDGSCFQTERGIDETRPEVGYFFTTDTDGKSIVEPIRWCDPSVGIPPPPPDRVPSPPPEEGSPTHPSVETPPPPAESRESRIPRGFSSSRELNELRDVFNAMTREHELPKILEMAFRCQTGKLDFLIRMEEEWRGKLPKPFKPLLAQLIDTPHKCLQPGEITWTVEPGGNFIRADNVSANQVLTAVTRLPELERYPWTAFDSSLRGGVSGSDIVTLYRILTARRFDLPLLEDFKSDLRDEGERVHLQLNLLTRRGDPVLATGLLRLLCAHLAATEARCAEVEVLSCVAPDLGWSRQVTFSRADLSRRPGCYTSEILRSMPEGPGGGR